MAIMHDDGKYYKVTQKFGVADRVLIAARNRIYKDFCEICRPARGDSILDVGVSDVVNDASNVIERDYPFRERIVAAGLGEGHDFRKAFPEIDYVRIADGSALPFQDRRFDVVVSNAVLEHVGSAENQRAFCAELCRVGRRVFITTPNRYFPVEHHTAIPFLHWSDSGFRWACRVTGNEAWADSRNLILMSRRRLVSRVEGLGTLSVGYTGFRAGPMSSNVFAYIVP